MELFDQHIADVLNDDTPHRASGPGRFLIVGVEPQARAAIEATLKQLRHQHAAAASLAEARSILSRSRFDIVIAQWDLSDGAGVDVAPLLQNDSTSTKLMLVGPATADAAMKAMRSGAVDLLELPLDGGELARRAESALRKCREERHRDERLSRLKKICRELNVARQEISKQVDALCDDLSNAYREIADQMSDVALASEFRTLLKQELDVEDLLRTTLEYLLTKTGPTNAAVFLPDSRGADCRFGLGAYVNYDCPRETISLLLDHLGNAICPQMADEEEIVAFSDAREFAEWVGADAGFLSNSQVIAFSCRHRGECLAVIVLFRNQTNPFDEKLAGTMDTMRQIIAEQLSHVIRVHHRARPSWPKEAAEGDLDYHDDDLGFGGYEGGLAA